MEFEPKILGFLCNWCSYAGADLAGVSRIQYPPSLRVIRVMCSGRVDPLFVIEALKTGLDGVIVMGCHPGDCHYLEGNYEAEVKFKTLKKLLKIIGLDNRVHLEWVSASEGNRFAEVIRDFTEKIKELGPSPLRQDRVDEKLLESLNVARRVVEDYRLRALVGRKRKILEEGNVYGEEIPEEKMEDIVDDALEKEFQRNQIYLSLINGSNSVKNISKLLDIDSQQVLEHVVVLRRKGLVAVDKIEGLTPLYTALKG